MKVDPYWPIQYKVRFPDNRQATDIFHGYARLYKELCRKEYFSHRTVIIQGSRSRSDQLINQYQVEEKTLVVQYGMEQVLDSHRLWAVITDCNCKGNVINPIIQPRTRY
jgi:hypothetical protein